MVTSCCSARWAPAVRDPHVGPCPGYGLIVGASNITLDLNGHRVSGDPQALQSPDKPGPLLRGVSRVTVMGGTVEGFDDGVTIMGGERTVKNVTANDNVNYCVVNGRDSQRADVVSADGPFCDLGDASPGCGSPQQRCGGSCSATT